MEADGFQADTEDDDEEDCIVISAQNGELWRRNKKLLSVFNHNSQILTTLSFVSYMYVKKISEITGTQTSSVMESDIMALICCRRADANTSQISMRCTALKQADGRSWNRDPETQKC